MDVDDLARLRVAISRLARCFNTAASETGLTPTQVTVLLAIVRHRSIGISELAVAESLNPTLLSRVIGKLDEMGLITRVTDPVDRRAALIEPTAAGRRMKQRLQEQRTAALAERLMLLTPEQEKAILAALPALEALMPDPRQPSPR